MAKEKQEENKTLRAVVIKTPTGSYELVGAGFCCDVMQTRFSIDSDTGISSFGKPAFHITWKLKGMEISYCPFCGKPIEFVIHEPSSLVAPTTKAVQEV